MRTSGHWRPWAAAAAAAALWAAPPAMAAGQSGGPYSIGRDVVVFSSSTLAIGSASYQLVPSVAQHGAVGAQAGGGYGMVVGFLSSPPPIDTDGDGVPDESDPDIDGDGVPNELDARPYDTDNDGLNNFEDDDDDNDGLEDAEEIQLETNPVRRDTDGDGFDDGVEVRRLGTDPLNREDCLRCTQATTAAGTMILTWASSTQVTAYLVQRASTLTGGGNWTNIAGPIAPTGAVMSVTDPSPSSPALYRIAVPPP